MRAREGLGERIQRTEDVLHVEHAITAAWAKISAFGGIIAAAPGEVVYSGSGLIAYGELIIIKHSDQFLSAYAHNRKRLVAEGQKVKAGTKIAEMGRNDRNQVLLHFEIRVNGKPRDPLTYLPRR